MNHQIVGNPRRISSPRPTCFHSVILAFLFHQLLFRHLEENKKKTCSECTTPHLNIFIWLNRSHSSNGGRHSRKRSENCKSTKFYARWSFVKLIFELNIMLTKVNLQVLILIVNPGTPRVKTIQSCSIWFETSFIWRRQERSIIDWTVVIDDSKFPTF